MNKSKISWTDFVWNPVTGCTKVSTGCKNCYAEIYAGRFWEGRKFSEIQLHEDKLYQPLRKTVPGKIFVNSMSDLFHPAVPDEFIDKVFAITLSCALKKKKHIFQILTKRPVRMRKYFNSILEKIEHIVYLAGYSFSSRSDNRWFEIFFSNIWIGVSVEDRTTARERIPLLLDTLPDELFKLTRFISAEPLLEEISLLEYYKEEGELREDGYADCWATWLDYLDWVIVGGESGLNARPMDLAWARRLMVECREKEVPFFFKQVGGHGRKLDLLDGMEYKQFPERSI